MDTVQRSSVNCNLLYLQDNLVMTEELCAACIQYKIFTEDTVESFMVSHSISTCTKLYIRVLYCL